jgi:predicted short-subunit dehydrogenase-like oxidoreductase (DUF2520 family)
LNGTALPLERSQMATYHAAAAIASNLVVALLDTAVATLMSSGMTEQDATAALLPLAIGALQNVASTGVVAGLTGPVKRGDAETVTRHLASVQDVPGVAAVYQALSHRALAIAARGGLPEAEQRAVAAALE